MRYFIYMAVTAIVFESLVLMATEADLGNRIFKENGLIEWAQIFLLVMMSLTLFQASKLNGDMKSLYHFLALLPIACIVRELDSFFDRNIAENTWKFIMVLPATYIVCFAYKNFQTLKSQLKKLIPTTSFGFLISGFILVTIFSRLIGQKILWKALMKDLYEHRVYRTVEESIELMGYLLIFIGTIEIYIACKKQAT